MADAPDNLDDLRRDLGRALSKMAELAPGYRKAREMYDGTAAEIAGSKVAEAIIAQSKATPVGFAHIPVDVIVEKVQLSGIGAEEPAAAEALTEWAEANDLDDEVEDWIRTAGVFGDYYVVLDPLEEEETGDDEPVAVPAAITAVGMSPLSTIMVYDRKTQRRPEYGLHVWDAGKDADGNVIQRAMLYYADASVKLISEGGTSDDASSYKLDIADGDETEDAYIGHAGGRPLLRHLAIGGKPYGVPLHRRAFGFQDAITKVSANNLVNVDAQGLPSRWALMDPLAEIDDDIDDDFGTDGPTTTAAKSDGQRGVTGGKVRAMPGAIAYLRGVKQTGTYDAGDSAGFLSNLDWYVRAMAVACGIPLFEFDLTGEQPSGEARRRAESRANRRAKSVMRQVRGFLEGMAETVLVLAGVVGTPSAGFEPVESATDKEGLELVSIKVKAGIPVRTALIEAGYPTNLVDEWFPADEAARLSLDALAVLAEILSKLGSAKTLGVITDAQMSAMLPDVLPAVEATEGAVVEDEDESEAPEGDAAPSEAADLKERFDALGSAIRSGGDQEQAAERVGLSGLRFPNLPTTIRVPETEAAGLEGAAPAAPEAPGADA